MKALKSVYYILFALSALISGNFIYNLVRAGIDMAPLSVAIIIAVLQVAGLIFVIISRYPVVMGIFSIISGIATFFAGGFAFASVGAPAPRLISDISITSMFASYYILAAYVVVGVLFIIMQFKNSKINGAEN
jgi:hypothetical protein